MLHRRSNLFVNRHTVRTVILRLISTVHEHLRAADIGKFFQIYPNNPRAAHLIRDILPLQKGARRFNIIFMKTDCNS
jgi:hypothetical protein